MTLPKNPSPDVGKLAKELRSGHRAALARAITLIESRRGDHQAAARDLVQALLSDTGKAVRVGITGSPGVGKSTTIDVLGIVMGTMIEQSFVTSLIKSDGSILPFFERPIAAILAAMAIGALIWPMLVWVWRKLKGEAPAAASAR